MKGNGKCFSACYLLLFFFIFLFCPDIGQAGEYFYRQHLVQVFFVEGGQEVLFDLGDIEGDDKTLDLTLQNYTLPGISFLPSMLGVSSWAEIQISYYKYDKIFGAAKPYLLFGTSSPSAPGVNTAYLSPFQNCGEGISNGVDTINGNTKFTSGLPHSTALDSSFVKKYKSDGSFAEYNLDYTKGAPFLEIIPTQGYFDMYLYNYHATVPSHTLIAGPGGTAYTVVIRVYADGHTVLNPPAAQVSDGDGDGVPDSDDNCPVDYNSDQTDTDGDGDGDACDTDDDNDGVSDGADQCPGTPAGTMVGGNGCELTNTDDDGDGVPNSADKCPNTPSGVEVNASGCPDADSDGISDDEDQCPNTPDGDTVDDEGCTIADSDHDGVPDDEDECADTPSGTKVTEFGCKDADGDGVTEIEIDGHPIDNCPNTPSGETVDANGCTVVDSDHDGVADDEDGCPNDANKTQPGECGCGVQEGTCGGGGPLPVVKDPLDGTEVKTRQPILTVYNETELAGSVSYVFEVYKNSNQTLRIVNSSIPAGDSTTSWSLWKEESLEQLKEDRTYYWRVRATNGTETTNWTKTVSFKINANSAVPVTPAANTPQNGASVADLTPDIVVNNILDLENDTHTYDFELYGDEYKLVLLETAADIPEGDEDITVWHVESHLNNNTWYWWRARAVDSLAQESPWTDLESFQVVIPPPASPVVSTPLDGEGMPDVTPAISIINVAGVEDVTHSYSFELFSDEEMLTPIDSGANIPEAEGSVTNWQVETLLNNNTWYWWRSKTTDSLFQESSWSRLYSFQTTLDNDPPSTPEVIDPKGDEVVRPDEVVLSIRNASDPEGAPLTYYFEIDSVSSFNSDEKITSGTVSESTGDSTSWLPDVPLNDQTNYYWRAIAFDGEIYSDAWAMASFFVSDNQYAPESPMLRNPYSGAVLKTQTPDLTVENATDVDGDVLTYTFQVFEEEDTEPVYEISNIEEGYLTTSIIVPDDLVNGITYRWRARASDGLHDSKWMPSFFTVDTDADELDITMVLSAIIRADATEKTALEVNKMGNSLNGLKIEVPKGALSEDMSFTIGIAENPPQLPDGYVLADDLNVILVLGPSGIQFNKTIKIEVPYYKRDGSNYVTILEKDTAGGSWETMPIKAVTDYHITFETDHFSMFAIAEEENGGDSGGGPSDSSGGGGCFISTIFR